MERMICSEATAHHAADRAQIRNSCEALPEGRDTGFPRPMLQCHLHGLNHRTTMELTSYCLDTSDTPGGCAYRLKDRLAWSAGYAARHPECPCFCVAVV